MERRGLRLVVEEPGDQKVETAMDETVATGEATVETAARQAVAEEARPERPAIVTDSEHGEGRGSLPRGWLAAAVGLMVLALAAIIYAMFFRGAPLPPTEIKSLAVLPLENLSGDPAQEYFADGITDALIGNLAKIGALRVISRTSIMQYKSMKKSLPQIAGELRVDAVVEGTVQRSGDHVHIRAQLIHAATDRHLWVETYERDVGDVLGLQSEIAHAIAREIQAKITPAEQLSLANTRPVSRKVLDDYLQGRYHQNKTTEEHLHKAIEYFQSAISADPSYAPAYAGLAQCYNSLGSVIIGALPPTEARRRGEEAATKALELDSSLVDAHIAMGYAKKYNWDWDGADQEFKRAIELNPSNGTAHSYYSRYFTSVGDADRAIAEMNIAQELDPLSLNISAWRGFVLQCARRYDEAIEQLRRVLALDPTHVFAHWNLGQTYLAKGQFDEAIAIFEKAAVLSGREPGVLGFLGMSYGFAGRKDEADQVLQELLELDRRGYVTPAAVANVYIGLGNKDQAFVWLEKAYRERSNYLAYIKVFPLVDSLRSDPRFDDLLRRIGLAP
jgi:TolB-like protein/Tfp pilus assembly protein PilF